jgi:murein DD-endopeptidase MepM/ murein hydrolase activator NlpD
VSIDVSAIVERARLAASSAGSDPVGRAVSGSAGSKTGATGEANERAKLERVAQEFESMLLVQVLRSMRNSGKWDDEEGKDTLGAESMFETLDVELATHLAKVKGLGLSKEMLESFDRMNTPPAPPAPLEMPNFEVPGVPVVPNVPGVPHAPAASAPVGPVAMGHGPTEMPTDGDVTSAFGWRKDPFTGAAKFHRGIDMKAAYGEDIQAAGDGRVVFSGQQGGYGTTVLIEHADGTRTRYAHLSVALVQEGEAVGSGQAIGRAGRSGRATGTHLHFEVIGADGRHMDPNMIMARHTGHAAD